MCEIPPGSLAPPMLPLDVYIVHMMKLSEIITKKHLTAEDIERNDRESSLVIQAAIRVAERVTQEQSKQSETTGT